MTFLDANVIVRYLTTDDPTKATRCERLFNQVAHGRLILATNVLVVAEVVWVLTGFYRLAKERVVDALLRLLSLEGLQLEGKERVLSALGAFRATAIDFIDAYNAAWMRARGLQTLYSYDADFDALQGLRRLEP